MTREYYLKHRAEILRKRAQQTPEQKERDRETRRRYYLKHRAEMIQKQAERQRNNREYHREAGRRSYQKHRSKYLQRHKEYNRIHREENRARHERWKATLKGQIARQRGSACHRARKYHVNGNFTVEDVVLLLVNQGEKCALCKKPFPPQGTWRRFDIDHILPLSRGGSNHLENLQLLCHPCNVKKDRRAV